MTLNKDLYDKRVSKLAEQRKEAQGRVRDNARVLAEMMGNYAVSLGTLNAIEDELAEMHRLIVCDISGAFCQGGQVTIPAEVKTGGAG